MFGQMHMPAVGGQEAAAVTRRALRTSDVPRTMTRVRGAMFPRMVRWLRPSMRPSAPTSTTTCMPAHVPVYNSSHQTAAGNLFIEIESFNPLTLN